MRVIDTLTQQEKIKLLSGDVVGIFTTLLEQNDPFFGIKDELCSNYYLTHSGNKTISSIYYRIDELCKLSTSQTDSVNSTLGKMLRSKFIEKWTKVYGSLISVYNPLNSFETQTSKVADNEDKETVNLNKKTTANNTDKTIYDTVVTDDGNTSSKETTTRKTNNLDEVYAYNSFSPTGDSESTEEYSETVEGTPDKNTTHNVQLKTGNDVKTFGIDENELKSGTDTFKHTIDETKTSNGRDVSGAKLINEEIELRDKYVFFDMVFRDIDSVITLQIYI